MNADTWEARWAALTGRPWGWVSPSWSPVVVTMDARWPILSRVMYAADITTAGRIA